METLNRILWALRKVRLPVSADGLVLDVGSGNCPYPRSDVLLERYTRGNHRCGASAMADRPLVLGDALCMPFRDKAFDFVVASHVLEHIKTPEVMLKELMRVARAGYIETPNLLLERFCPYPVHVLELIQRDGTLIIHKKSASGSDDFLARQRLTDRHVNWKRIFQGTPQNFHVRYFWQDEIHYEIDNPEQSSDWVEDAADNNDCDVLQTYQGSGWRTWGLKLLRSYYAHRRRMPLDWLSILACPTCRNRLERTGPELRCTGCAARYLAEPHPDFLHPLV